MSDKNLNTDKKLMLYVRFKYNLLVAVEKTKEVNN